MMHPVPDDSLNETWLKRGILVNSDTTSSILVLTGPQG